MHVKSKVKSTNTTSSSKRVRGLSGSDNIIWNFNLFFLCVCLGAVTRQLDITVFPGLGIGLILAAGVYYLINNRSLEESFNYTLKINMAVLLASIILASFFLWHSLLRGQDLSIAEHSVILFFLLGLSSTSALLRIISIKYSQSLDIEQKIRGLMGGPSLILSFCVAAICASLLMLIFQSLDLGTYLAFLKTKFLQRGIIPPLCLVLFFWGLILVLGKYSLSLRNLRFGRTERNYSSVLQSLWKEYIKSSRGKRSKEPTANFVELLWNANETFYLFPRYINWAIPILGFIGTVLGISLAAGEIGKIVGSSSLNIGDSIGAAMGPLGIAFDTTLIALSLSVFLAFAYTLLQRWEEQKFLFVEEFIYKIK